MPCVPVCCFVFPHSIRCNVVVCADTNDPTNPPPPEFHHYRDSLSHDEENVAAILGRVFPSVPPIYRVVVVGRQSMLQQSVPPVIGTQKMERMGSSSASPLSFMYIFLMMKKVAAILGGVFPSDHPIHRVFVVVLERQSML